ncbi:MAG: hypothetical protein KatS3mg002_0191 [Candidatus Woesearchaeota archaeon]|nr:MAG: hypothetical protein KatS3mg002_0191 [Candidatus Woesearchaeota archaeon]
MHQSMKIKLMLWFTILYLFFFTIVSISNRNYEFLYYTVVMSLIIIILIKYKEHLSFTTGIAFGLTIVAALHIFGGNVYIGETRLYDYWLTSWFKYDNLVHIIGTFTATIVAYTFIYQHLNEKAKNNKVLLSIIIVSMALGIGAVNEIMELFAVLFLNASEQVGDYLNNAFDLVYNLMGSIFATIYLFYIQKEQV